MMTGQIRQNIARAVSHEQQTHTMAQLIAQWYAVNGRQLEADQLAGIVHLVQTYIQFVPEVLEEVEKVAKKEGWQRSIAPILETAQSYFLQPFDFIPDTLGLAGLADDAYLAHTLFQRLSERLQHKTGKPLLVNDSGGANQFVRSLIGEPIATMLDQKVTETLDGSTAQDVLSQLLALAGSACALNVAPSFNDYAIKQQVDLQMDLVTTSYSPSW